MSKVSSISFLVVSTLLLAAWGQCKAHASVIVADSVADFNTSQAQGYNGWSYLGALDGGSPTLMDFATNVYGLPNPSWSMTHDAAHTYTTIWATGAHPGGNTASGNAGTTTAVRRWTSTITGLVNVAGSATLEETHSIYTNGTSMGIFLNGVQIGSTLNMLPSDATNTPQTFNLNVSVTTGETLDFILYGGINLDYHGQVSSDATDFAATITLVPEPASLGLLAVGGAFMLRRRRR